MNHFGAVKACVFDAYGTLFDLGDLTRAAVPTLGRQRADALNALWRRKQLDYSWLRSLIGRHTDFWHVTGESLDHAMLALDVADPLLRARLMEAWLTPPPFADVVEGLGAVRAAGLRTAILSNGSVAMLTGAVGAAGIQRLLDAVISVEPAGVFKPHPAVYALAVDRLDLPPGEIAFVTANGWDAAGAAAFGFKVAWLNRQGAAPEMLPAGPKAEFRSLAELAPLLRP
ncbi:MAG: haloacid dehalogenase type II [Alphaproteobacteria bacterium]|nr:haloacid dehalogenase type II [Alphaproteobacteria bacterium]